MVIGVSSGSVYEGRRAGPRRGVPWCVFRDARGPACGLAYRDARGQVAEAARLHEQIAEDGGFLRPRENTPAGAVGGELVEQRVARASADDVDIVDPRSRHRLERFERFGVTRREAFQYQPSDLAVGLRRREAPRRARGVELPAHVSASRELGSVEIDREAL